MDKSLTSLSKAPRSAPGSMQTIANERARYGALFDAEYYARQVGDLDPQESLSHYRDHASELEGAPHPLFDPVYYVAQLDGAKPADPLLHFIEHGWRNGLNPHPLFDTQWYLEQVDGELGNSSDPLNHYLAEGYRKDKSPHRLVHMAYARSQLPRRLRRKIEPMQYLIKHRFRKNLRSHPLFSPDALTAQLRANQIEISHASLLREFADWSGKFSLSHLLDLKFYSSRYPASRNHPQGPVGHFIEVGQFGDYDPNPYFDSEFYRSSYLISSQDWPSAFMHYMTHERTGRFNPRRDFSVRHYCRKHRGVFKSGVSILEHFLSKGRFNSCEVQPFIIPKHLREQLVEAKKLEPEINVSPRQLDKLMVFNRHQANITTDVYARIIQHVGSNYRALVFAPFLSRGGADLVAKHFVSCLHQYYSADEVLLFLTDGVATKSIDWLPKDTRWCSLSHFGNELKPRAREHVVQYMIEDMRPDACFNVNSKAAWELFAKSGHAISQLTQFYSSLFCYDYDANQRPVGYAREYFGRTIRHLAGVFSDNAQFLTTLRDTYNLSDRDAAKLLVAYNPAKLDAPQINARQLASRLASGSEYRRQILWAGRLDRQKRPQLMLSIAKSCPQFDFHVFGANVLEKQSKFEVPDNVHLHGEYAEFFELPLAEMDAFLYTAAWDGIPNVLLESLHAGLPTIAPKVGGIAEVVHEETGWLISESADPDAYIEALNEIASSPETVLRRTANAQALVANQHCAKRFSQVVTANLPDVAHRADPKRVFPCSI